DGPEYREVPPSGTTADGHILALRRRSISGQPLESGISAGCTYCTIARAPGRKELRSAHQPSPTAGAEDSDRGLPEPSSSDPLPRPEQTSAFTLQGITVQAKAGPSLG